MIQFSDAFNRSCGQTWTGLTFRYIRLTDQRATPHNAHRRSLIWTCWMPTTVKQPLASILFPFLLKLFIFQNISSVTSFKWMNPAECDAAFAAPFLMLHISRLLAIAERDPKKIAVLLWKQLDFSSVSESSLFPAFFLNISSRLGALRQTLIDESVCLVAGILATSPLTDTQTHTCAHAITNLAFSSFLSSNN